jgi:hypothetical protein
VIRPRLAVGLGAPEMSVVPVNWNAYGPNRSAGLHVFAACAAEAGSKIDRDIQIIRMM